jgi:hypothetical protein
VAEPKVELGCVANLFSRMMHFRHAGDIEHGHTHAFDHLTLLAAGALKVTVDGISTEFKAPHMIYIRKDKNHELVALADNTVAYCIHALRTSAEGDILDPSMVPDGVVALNLPQVQKQTSILRRLLTHVMLSRTANGLHGGLDRRRLKRIAAQTQSLLYGVTTPSLRTHHNLQIRHILYGLR